MIRRPSIPFKASTLAAWTLSACLGLSSALAAPAAQVAAGHYTVVDTAQTKTFDNSAEIATPAAGSAFDGQDAQVKGHAPRYRVDAVNKTVFDENTGLTWLRSPDTNGDGRINADDKMTLAQAQAWVKRANAQKLGGASDWRLPTVKELYSLIEFKGMDPDPQARDATGLQPFIDTQAFGFAYGDTAHRERIIDAQYLSSTAYVSTTGNGDATQFGVNFADGRIKGYGLTDPHGRTKTFSVQLVRGASYGANDFEVNSNRTVTDHATGLMWSLDDSGRGMNWQQALAWARQMNAERYLGYSDWRVPNAKELQSIVDYTRSPATTGSAAIDARFHTTAITNEAGQKDYPYYWTSTTHIRGDGSGSAAVYIAFGRSMGYITSTSGKSRWLDVHGAGSQRSDPKTGSAKDYAQGHGPQGDAVRIDNYVRLVRDVKSTE